MTAPTTATSSATRTASPSVLLLLLVVALLATLVGARPAGAQDLVAPTEGPTPPVDGPTDIAVPEVAPTLAVVPDCDPDGFHYTMVHPDAPANAVHALQYREAPNGPIQALPIGPASGFVPSGEGTFLVRGAIVVQGQPFHQYDWVEVTVFCPGLVPTPEGPTEVEIDLTPVCEPAPGVEYAITISNAPDGPLAHTAQWRELGGGPVTTVDGQAGTLATGEGTVEVRGVVHAQGPGFHASDWAEVTVDCTDPGGDDDPDPEDEPEDEPDPDDVPRPGTPTFTG